MEKTSQFEIIEGMLFLAGEEGIDIAMIQTVLSIDEKEAIQLYKDFTLAYQNRPWQGLQLVCLGERYKLTTLSTHHAYYSRMIKQNKSTLSNAALETLAIIAYRQPVTRAQIEEIRGVSSDAMVRKLLAQALIKEVGRASSPGLPVLYSVTREFMDTFGLASLAELPAIEDFDENIKQDLFFNK